ncbi:STE3-domain-containing protein [Peniophora sp. CONT]|nr:STE3-domain-containing protein [Peniophora sp. CONT]
MAAADPTYPLYPVASFLAAAALLLVLSVSLTRQSWNLGVVFLCFWLFLETLINGVNEIVWADNAEIKLFVYCDIVTHLQLISSIVKPASTFIITRRLYLIASLRSVELPNPAARRKNLFIEWTLGLVLPVLIGGPIYYIVQVRRFQVVEGFGCLNASVFSILTFLLISSWSIFLPLLSILTYYPMVVRVFYRQGRDTNHFLYSNDSVSRTNYMRVLAVASIDILLTLPIGITNLVLIALAAPHTMTFYPGWKLVHSHWAPTGETYARLLEGGTFNVARTYFTRWTSPVLAFAIFALFGLTAQARATYCRPFLAIKELGWTRIRPQKAESAHSIVSLDSDHYRHKVMLDAELGYVSTRSCAAAWWLTFIPQIPLGHCSKDFLCI